MAPESHRAFKNRLYAQFARVGKAIASPRRLELLELLGQGERTVDSHIRSIRRKLGSDVVRTVHGVGYAVEDGAA